MPIPRRIKRLEKRSRAVLVALLKRLLRPLPATHERDRVDAILLIRPDERLGNAILCTCCLDELRALYPDARVDFLATDVATELLAADPRIDGLHPFPKKELLANPLAAMGLAADLRRRRYDVALDLSHMHSLSLTSALLARLSSANWRVGYQRSDSSPFLNIEVAPHPEALRDRRHEGLIIQDLLAPLRPPGWTPPPEVKPRVFVRGEHRSRLAVAMETAGLCPGQVVGVHLGGRRGKKWHWANFLHVCNTLASRGVTTLVFWGPAEEEDGRRLVSSAARRVRLAPAMSVPLLAACFSLCRAVIACDTGPMHLAVAVGAPTVQVFRAGAEERYGYRSPPHRIARPRTGPDGWREVVAAVQEVLSLGPAGA